MKFNELDAKTQKTILANNPDIANEIASVEKQKRKASRFTAEDERTYAIMVLNVIAKLKKNERTRILRRALKMNEI